MKVTILKECGYEESALGFSLSYNSTIERAKEILPKYAFKNNGENKFLRSMIVWLDITAPRFFLTELDTYKVGTTRLSESTIHTLSKKELTQNNFEYSIHEKYLEYLNFDREAITNGLMNIEYLKNDLPEGFLQRIIYQCNYATLQNIYNQRKNHKLPQWKYFCSEILKQLDHPEFISPLTSD